MLPRWSSIENAVDNYVTRLVGNESPVNIERVASGVGVAEIEPRRISTDGYLAVRPDGQYAIRYNEDADSNRRRFTIAHEIGHLILADICGFRVSEPVARGGERNDREEILVNRIAAKLLMPESRLVSALSNSARGWWQIAQLARRYEVSTQAMLIRLSELRRVFSLTLECSTYSSLRHAPRVKRIRTSRGSRVLFFAKPECVLQNLLQVSAVCQRPAIPLEINGNPDRLQVVSRIWQADNGRTEFCFVGWRKFDSMR